MGIAPTVQYLKNVLGGVEKRARNLFELMIIEPVHGIELDWAIGRMRDAAMQIE